MPLPVYHLIYTSIATAPMTRQGLIDLLKQSRRNNMELAITGLLLYAGGGFMQLLEGSQDRIDNLMVRILKDSRHRQVDVLLQGYVPRRQFSNWSMAFLDFASPNVKKLPDYSTFLEPTLQRSDLTQDHAQSMRLLHSFKAIMSASSDEVLRLAETIKARKKPVRKPGKILRPERN